MDTILTKKQFLVLNALRETPGLAQRSIADVCDTSLESANAALRELEKNGLVDGGSLTPSGHEALHPYKVENAVIMAAGLSSRFAPISYEKPKGLLKVRGEVLIERQIEQLREAGIHNITIVVGYKKEYFFYLEGKYGVSIVVNDEYATRNNNGSLWRVRDRLSNTYVCSSDDYFTENPFEPYVWRSYYAAQWAEGKTDEWCMSTGAHDRITNVTVGGSNSWYMLGHVYFDRAFSRGFTRVLEAEYDLPRTAGKLWEQLFAEHVDELDMAVRPYPTGVINEFDSLDELRSFDPHFLENIDSEIFDNICRTLGCEKSEIRDVYPLKQGITNLSCHFATNAGEWVYRHPGVGTELLIDRAAEATALEEARALGLDDTFVHADPSRGWKISRFVPGCRPFDAHDPAQVAPAMRMARTLHASDARVDRRFDYYEEAKRYESLLRERGPIDIPGFAEMSAKVDRVAAYVRADGAPVCLCHNDLSDLNFLIDRDGRYHLIDWEYAGMSDYANDFGTFCVSSRLTQDEALGALKAYFGRTPTPEEVRHNLAHVQLAGWCWYLWSVLKEAEGDTVGEMFYVYYRYATDYLDRVLALYEDDAPACPLDEADLDRIASVLGCEKDEIGDFFPLDKGLTNFSWHFSAPGGEYVYRRPGVGTEKFIDRVAETQANSEALRLGIDRTFVHEDDREGWKVCRFVPNARSLDPENPEDVRRAMELSRSFHESSAHIDATFDFFQNGLGYESLLLEHGPVTHPGYQELRSKVERLNGLAAADGYGLCFCHNDYLPLNFLIGEDGRMDVIDWEFAGMGDPGNDFGTFVICSEYNETQAEEALSYYFGRTPTFVERRHFWSRVVLGGWCWYVWALEKEAEGAGVGEWLDIYRSYAADHVDRVLSWYEEARS